MWSSADAGPLASTTDERAAPTASSAAPDGRPTDPVIRVRNLSKCYSIYDRPQDRLKQSIVPRLRRALRYSVRNYYREFWALRDLSFDVRRGETVGIIGRNGAGKSTLLQILCGTLHPTSGTVEIAGKVAALLELGSGFNPEFSGRENVYLNASILGLTRKEIDVRLPAILDFADIGEFVDMPVKTYSTGMVVRLAFSVIAHVDADILIIDEALAVGDAFFVQKCMAFLRRFMKTGTVLFVSHDTPAVTGLCGRAIWLQDGKLRAEGDPKTITELYHAALYEEKPGIGGAPGRARPSGAIRDGEGQFLDQRLQYLNLSQYRNDIELFRFDPDASSFGTGQATITAVELHDAEGRPLLWCVGGEEVVLVVRCQAHAEIARPIIGFLVKDRLGQVLFSDNSHLTYPGGFGSVNASEDLEALFSFQMPILPAGDYSICAALADGTQEEHLQHHWINDALLFKSHSSSVATGLVGIPMRSIELRRPGRVSNTSGRR